MHVTSCRMCSSTALKQFLDLGSTAPAAQFLFKHQLKDPEEVYPLRVVMCEECGLAQLDYVVPAEILYCRDYPYEASTTAVGRKHWGEFAESVVRMLGLKSGSLVVDVGSNVGVLLQMFKKNGTRVLGIDPAENIVAIANSNGITTIPAFFNSEAAKSVLAEYGHASVITATNSFAHIDDLHDVMRAVDILLAEKGAFIVEAPYFVELLQSLEYDTIYHEHLSYLSLKPLVKFFAKFGMEIFEVQRRDIHGGSIRIFVRRAGAFGGPASNIITELLVAEGKAHIYESERLQTFADAVAENRRDLRDLLLGLKKQGKRIAGVSAPAKGMTLVNYCGIGSDILDFITEKSKLKIGRFTPGTHTPVLSDDALLENR